MLVKNIFLVIEDDNLPQSKVSPNKFSRKRYPRNSKFIKIASELGAQLSFEILKKEMIVARNRRLFKENHAFMFGKGSAGHRQK